MTGVPELELPVSTGAGVAVGAADGAAEAGVTPALADGDATEATGVGDGTAVASVRSVYARSPYVNSGVPLDGMFCQPANRFVRYTCRAES